jgi:metal-responsive CopG/Arc/MetJ family transcriptional regulator
MDVTMAKTDDKKFINTLMEGDLVEKLDVLVEDHGSTRAQFIRLLVRQAWEAHQAEQDAREAEGMRLVVKSGKAPGKHIKTLRGES